MDDEAFWAKAEALVAAYRVKIDRPKGSVHPRYPDTVYPLDYGYLVGTRSSDSGGVDVWVGSLPGGEVTAVLVTVDAEKQDAEVKILLGCTPQEARTVLDFHNSGSQAGLLIERADAHPFSSQQVD